MAALSLSLLLAGHMAFWRGRNLGGSGCAQGGRHAARLDRSLLDSIQQLRYEEALLEAEHETLLGTSFSQVRLPQHCGP